MREYPYIYVMKIECDHQLQLSLESACMYTDNHRYTSLITRGNEHCTTACGLIKPVDHFVVNLINNINIHISFFNTSGQKAKASSPAMTSKMTIMIITIIYWKVKYVRVNDIVRVQRKSVLQPANRASCSWHVLTHKSFQLAPKPFLISRIDYNPSVINLNFPKKQHLPIGQVKNKNH